MGFGGRVDGGCGSRKAETKSRLSRPGGPRHYGGRLGESTRRRLRAGGPPSHGLLLLDVQANSGFGGAGNGGCGSRKAETKSRLSRPGDPRHYGGGGGDTTGRRM